MMPGMNGLEVARHLAARPEPPAVVFVTAFDEHAVQAFEVQAFDYLLKPVRPGAACRGARPHFAAGAAQRAAPRGSRAQASAMHART